MTTVFTLIALSLFGPQDQPSLMSVTSLRCEFPVVVSVAWTGEEIDPVVASQEFSVHIDGIQESTARFIGNEKAVDVVVIKRTGTVTMIEVTGTMVHTTTVYDALSEDGRFKAVYSRHSHLLGIPVPSQQYGHCKVLD